MIGTECAIRHAAREGLPICLVLNKIDRLLVRWSPAPVLCCVRRVCHASAHRWSSSFLPTMPTTSSGTP